MPEPSIRDRIVREMPSLVRGIFDRVYARAAPPRLAIKAKCYECTGGLRVEITHCTALGCPLWEYRPYRTSGKPLDHPETPPESETGDLGGEISGDPLPQVGV
jgi:hypothetical protein